MAITIGKKPENNFTNPLGLLSDCHRRIEYFLGLLVTVTQQAQGNSLSGEQRKALETAIFYFKQAAPKHTLDEEESLFPRMRVSGNAQAQAALAVLDSLHTDHTVANELHKQVEEIARQWLEEDKLSGKQVHRLTDMLDELSAIYQRHIATEDNEVFPLAKTVLEKAELESVGREMAARRGIDLKALSAKLES